MGGGTTQTSSSSSTSPNIPGLNSTLQQLLTNGPNSVQGIFNKGPQVFGQSLYAGVGPTTTGAWNASLAAANNPAYASGVNSAIGANNNLISNGGMTAPLSSGISGAGNIAGQFGNLAGTATNPSLTESTLMNAALGNDYGTNDPGYAAMRSKLASDVMGNVGSSFTNSGRFGGGSYVNAATNDLTNSLGSLDYQNFLNDRQNQMSALSAIEGQRQQGLSNQAADLNSQLGALSSGANLGQAGIGNLYTAMSQIPGLFQAGQLPSATASAVGSAQDTNAQNTLQGQYDLFNRQANAGTDLLSRLMAPITGASSAGGSTTTQINTQPSPPLWQSLLGLGIGLL